MDRLRYFDDPEWDVDHVDVHDAGYADDVEVVEDLVAAAFNNRPYIRWLENIEAWLALLSGTALAMFVVCLMCVMNGVVNRAMNGLPVGLYAVAVLALSLTLEGPFLYRLWASVCCGERPVGPAIARRIKIRFFLLRLFSALWWLFHICVGMFLVLGGEVQLIRNAQQQNGVLLATLFFTVLLFGMSVCCNVFVAQFVKVVWTTDSAVEKFWHWRFVIDASLTGVALLIVASL